MSPSSPWAVDYAEDSCVLRRAFSDGEDTAILELRQLGPRHGYEITIASETLAGTSKAPRVRYGTDESWSEPALTTLIDGGGWRGVRFSDSLRPAALQPDGEALPAWPDAERNARETAVAELTVADSFERELTFQTGTMHAPMEAMRACLRQLVAHWGLDPDAQAALSRAVTPVGQTDWQRRILDAYPRDMLRQGKSASVPTRLIVGPDGRPSACKAFAEPSFEQATCANMMRYARFEPALDAAGLPVASYFITTVIYQIAR